jgi:hypothetical protein
MERHTNFWACGIVDCGVNPVGANLIPESFLLTYHRALVVLTSMRMISVLLVCVFLMPPCVQLGAQDSSEPAENSFRWLLSFKQSNAAYETYNNPRLLALLRQGLPHYAVPWYRARGKKLFLPDGAAYAISTPGSVGVESNRYVTITGEMPLEGDAKGLLWCDTGAKDPTMIFVLMNQRLGVGKDDSGSLYIYTKHDGTDFLLPPQFVASVLAWEKATRITKIVSVTLHDADDRTATLPISSLSDQ